MGKCCRMWSSTQGVARGGILIKQHPHTCFIPALHYGYCGCGFLAPTPVCTTVANILQCQYDSHEIESMYRRGGSEGVEGKE